MKTSINRMIIVMILLVSGMTIDAQDNGARKSISKLDPGFEAGKQWFVAIAVSGYEKWPSLQYPVKDAISLRDALISDYYIDRVIELYDSNATRSNISKLFIDLQAGVGVHDSVLIYYAGHGYLDENSNTGFWIPADAGANVYEQENWIVNSQVRGYIANIKSSHVCLIMDSCFSGDMLDTERGISGANGADFFKKAYKRTSRQVLTSGASESVPDRSEFARLIVRALQKNTNPYIDPLMLYDEVRLGMNATTPLFGYLKSTGHQEGASFILFRKETKESGIVVKEESVLTKTRTELKKNETESSKTDTFSVLKDSDSGMVYIGSGNFLMGSKEGVDHERPAHEVRLTGFSIASRETTFNEYDAYCIAEGKKIPYDEGWGRGGRPVINVSFLDAVEYCNWRSANEKLSPCYKITGGTVACNFSANGYRLPTEAEWEYAARSGNKNEQAKYSGSDNVGSVAWYKENSKKKTTETGMKKPNGLGLFDMSGNVWEWCWDYYGSNYYASSHDSDPAGPASGDSRILRGGSWYNGSSYERVACRGYAKPDTRDNTFGFRVARSGK